MDKIKTVGVV